MSKAVQQTLHEAKPAKSRRAWRRWVVLSLLLAVATHPWWLQAFGEYLVAEEPLANSDVAVVLGGDHRLSRAAELYHDRTVSEIWLLEPKSGYAVTAGILPLRHDVEAEQLRLMGVPEVRIRLLPGSSTDIDVAGRVIVQAARESPEKRVLILCHRQHGRNMLLLLESISGEASGLHFAILGIPSDKFDESNWWKSRTGWKETFGACCQLLFTVVHGVDAQPEPFDWDPDAYEQRLISRYGGAGCHAQQ